MLLTKEEIKQQTRDLWKKCFQDSDEFLDMYFEEKYSDEANITLQPEGEVVGALQSLAYRMTFYGAIVPAYYLSGLSVSESYRKRGMASALLHEAHRRMYQQGGILSFLVPGDEQLQHFYEQPHHGAYWTAVYRKLEEVTQSGPVDEKIEISQPDDWGQDLYVFFRRNTSNMPFMLHPSENDFFAALADCDLEGGMVLVARRKHRLLGVCLAVVEKDGKCVLRSLLSTDERVKDCFIHYLKEKTGVTQVYARVAVAGSTPGAIPYAMARVINVEKFLRTVVSVYPDFELHIGVGEDLDIPENNGYYMVKDGKVVITDEKPESIVTPGGLAAMFLAAHPLIFEMMLDE